jgi:hypothetical protein
MGYDAIKALSNNSRGQKPAVRRGKSMENAICAGPEGSVG